MNGVFGNAVAMALTPSGRFYVLEGDRDEVIRFSPEGSEERRAGGRGWSGLTFDSPADISALNDLEIYVADRGNNRVLRLDPALAISAEFRTEEPGVTFRYPLSVCQSGLGRLLILDAEFSRIVELDQNRSVSRIFGGSGTGAGFLREPLRVRTAADGTVFVQEPGAVVMFDVYGNFLRTVGGPVAGTFITFTLAGGMVFLLDTVEVRIFDQNWNTIDTVTYAVDTGAGEDVPVDLQADAEWIYLLRPTSVERIPYGPDRPRAR